MQHAAALGGGCQMEGRGKVQGSTPSLHPERGYGAVSGYRLTRYGVSASYISQWQTLTMWGARRQARARSEGKGYFPCTHSSRRERRQATGVPPWDELCAQPIGVLQRV